MNIYIKIFIINYFSELFYLKYKIIRMNYESGNIIDR